MKVKLDKGAYMPTRAHDLDAGLDIYCPVDTYLNSRGSLVIDTGVHVELPPGTVGLVKSRSSMYIVKSIITEGVVDEGYRGAIKIRLTNLSNDNYNINAGDRIAQLVIVPCLRPELELVDALSESERGDNGFGSTGN